MNMDLDEDCMNMDFDKDLSITMPKFCHAQSYNTYDGTTFWALAGRLIVKCKKGIKHRIKKLL